MAILAKLLDMDFKLVFPTFTLTLIYKPILKSIRPKIAIISPKILQNITKMAISQNPILSKCRLWGGLNNNLICLNFYKMHHIEFLLPGKIHVTTSDIYVTSFNKVCTLLCFKSIHFFKESCKLEVVSRLIYVTKTENSMSYQ